MPSSIPEDTFSVSGTLAITLGLAEAPHVTHVVALNTESGEKYAVAVDPATGAFKMPLLRPGEGDQHGEESAEGGIQAYVGPDGALDRVRLVADHPDVAAQIEGKTDAEAIAALDSSQDESQAGGHDAKPGANAEATPWILAYVDATKVGKDMLVSRFGAQTLDTISPGAGAKSLSLGEITPVAGDRATSTATYADVLGGTAMSEATATAFGAIDDVSLRYINPDIDGDGVLDSPVLAADGTRMGEQRRFILDFHNRFNLVAAGTTMNLDHQQLKNRFADEAVGGLDKLDVVFTGTGIIPEMEKSEFTTPPTSYKWTFDANVELGTNGPVTCTVPAGATSLPAGTPCTKSYTVDPTYGRYQLGIEVASPPEGTYKLEAGGKTFTWTNVQVSDFSAGKGFLILLVKYVVEAEALKAIEYKYLRKGESGWVPATEEELRLIIKGEGGFISLHLDDADHEIGLGVPKQPTGRIELKDLGLTAGGNNPPPQATFDAIKAGNGLEWSRFRGAGVSYDDKLGMRFFF